MLIGAFSLALGLTNDEALIFNVVIVGTFIGSCIFAKADQVWASNQNPDPSPRPTVAAVKVDPNHSDSEVAAVSFKKQNKNNKGKPPFQSKPQKNSASTASTPPTTKPKGTRHPTAKGKDENLCKIHFAWGINGNYCAAPWKCPMKDVFASPK